MRHKSQFNIIDALSGLKVDIIIPAPDAFNESRFARSRRVHAEKNLEVCFTSPEDAIMYFREGGSEKHLRDITGVLKVGAGTIDAGYIDLWASVFGLDDIWAAVRKRAGGST